MPRHAETRPLPYSAEQMFDLVADVGRYQEFLPWVVATRIRQRDERSILADLIVGFGPLRETFTSRVALDRPRAIDVDYVDGPLKQLHNSWTFKPDEQGGCLVDFTVDFAFRSRTFEAIAGACSARRCARWSRAFEARAAALYGAGASRQQQLERAKRRLKPDAGDGRYRRTPACRRRSRRDRHRASARANTTVPTGFLSLPPAGPAMPVIATATSAPLRSSAPCAMPQATAIETAPKVSSTSSLTPSIDCFDVVAIGDEAGIEDVRRRPESRSARPTTSPPVQLSATATCSPAARLASTTLRAASISASGRLLDKSLRKPDRTCDRLRGDSLAATGKTKPLGGGCLDADPGLGEAQHGGDAGRGSRRGAARPWAPRR